MDEKPHQKILVRTLTDETQHHIRVQELRVLSPYCQNLRWADQIHFALKCFILWSTLLKINWTSRKTVRKLIQQGHEIQFKDKWHIEEEIKL